MSNSRRKSNGRRGSRNNNWPRRQHNIAGALLLLLPPQYDLNLWHQLRWLISADTELNNNGVGNRTGIDYPADANSYKFALLSLQEKNPVAMKRLLDVWDKQVFPNYSGSRSAEPLDMGAGSAAPGNTIDPIQSDQEHFARMQAAMARAQIANSPDVVPAASPNPSSNEVVGAPVTDNTVPAGKPLLVPLQYRTHTSQLATK